MSITVISRVALPAGPASRPRSPRTWVTYSPRTLRVTRRREHTVHVPVRALIGSAIAGCALTRRLLASMQSSLCSASWTLACCSAQSCRPAHAQKGQSRHGRWLGSRWHASAGMLRPTLNPYTVSTSVVSAWACGVRIVLVLVLGFPPRPLASD